MHPNIRFIPHGDDPDHGVFVGDGVDHDTLKKTDIVLFDTRHVALSDVAECLAVFLRRQELRRHGLSWVFRHQTPRKPRLKLNL